MMIVNHKTLKITLIVIISIFLTGCNTVVGTAQGVAKDTKAFYIYSRDAISQNDISDTSD